MLLTMAPTVAFAAEDDEGNTAPATSGTCGAEGSADSVKWNFNSSTGTLKISGTGKMSNLNNSTETENISDGAGTYPWANLKDSITNIVIADGVTSIGSKAFIAYTNVTSVNIGKDVSEIGVGALSQLSACTTFNVSSENSNFTTDATGALFDHSKTKLIAFPCGSSVEEYAIPATVKVISYGAFSRAAHLKTITIPTDSSLSTIGYGAFAFTTALETVNVIPASVETIGDIPFAQSGVKYIYCADKDTKDRIQNKVNGLLVDVLLTDETPAIEFTDNGYTYRIDDGKALLVSAPKNVATPTVPSGVTYQGTTYPVTGIWKGAFAISLDWTEANSSADKRNEAITSVVLPDSVTQIGERAFYFCKNLSKITIQANTVSIDYLAFATQNTNGTTVDFSAVTTLQSNGTDKWAGVKKVILNNEDQLDTIKSNVNTGAVAVIGNSNWVMGSDGNWAEQPKTNLAATVNNIAWTFDAVGGKATLKAYSPKTATSVTVPSTLTVDGVTYTVTELDRGLFGWDGAWNATNDYNTSIKSVVIPKTVTTIGADMFRYSKNLESVKIQGESITFKSNRTFSNTNSLKVLDMSAVKSIAFGANGNTYFSNMGSNNSSAVIYVSSSDIMRAVEDHRSTTSPCYLAYAVTNGGTFKENPTSNTALATPVKAGYTFAGWYSSSDFAEGTKLTDNNQPVTGTTYYAKWTEKATPAIAIKATPSTLTGGGSVELTVSGVPTEGQLAVTCDNDIKVTEKDGKYTAQLPNATKDYTFTAKYTGTDNYNDVEKTCVVKVTRKSSHSSSSGSSTTPTNTVSASTASNGKVALDKNTAKKGNTVTVTVTPDAGYQLDKLTVTDAKGKTVDVTKKSDGKYTFTMPDNKVTITPTFSKIEDTKPSKNGFDDVASSDWFADAVKYVSDKGLMSGTGSDKFAPSATTTRAMLMTVLARYAGEDTTGGATWYEKGMDWAKAKGVSDGTNPNADITREQLVTMMYRYAGSPKADGKLDSFSDAASVSTYAADAMQWAVANGIVNGSNGKLNPQNNATRAEVAAILMRFCEMRK